MFGLNMTDCCHINYGIIILNGRLINVRNNFKDFIILWMEIERRKRKMAAMKKVKMCQKCNGGFIEEFQKLLEGKEKVSFEAKCVGSGKCGTETPFCRVDQGKTKTVLEAATVEELAAQI